MSAIWLIFLSIKRVVLAEVFVFLSPLIKFMFFTKSSASSITVLTSESCPASAAETSPTVPKLVRIMHTAKIKLIRFIIIPPYSTAAAGMPPPV